MEPRSQQAVLLFPLHLCAPQDSPDANYMEFVQTSQVKGRVFHRLPSLQMLAPSLQQDGPSATYTSDCLVYKFRGTHNPSEGQ